MDVKILDQGLQHLDHARILEVGIAQIDCRASQQMLSALLLDKFIFTFGIMQKHDGSLENGTVLYRRVKLISRKLY